MLAYLSNYYATKHQTNINDSSITEAEDSQYTIVNRTEIGKKLHLLFESKTILSIKVPGKFADSTLLTTIIQLDDLHILLGGFQNDRFNNELLMQDTLTATANFNGIDVSFVLSKFSGHISNGEFNIKSPHPESLEWMQRRNARRVKVPMTLPVKIQHQLHKVLFDVSDISVTGLSYIDPTENRYFAKIGQRYAGCNLILPDKNIYPISLEVVNNIPVTFRHTEQLCRVGCSLSNPSYRLDTALQNLINHIDFFSHQ